MEYNPLPPMIPISACANPPPEDARAASQTRDYTGRKIPRFPDDGVISRQEEVLRELRDPSAHSAVRIFFAAETLDSDRTAQPSARAAQRYNLDMKFGIATCALFAMCFAQANPALPEPKSVTVPATIDHNRVVINGELTLPNGATERVRTWVDNGNPDLNLSRRLATLLGLAVTCDDKECSAPPPPEITVGGMKIPLTSIKQAKVPLKPVNAAEVLAPGMNAQITLPSSILRHYDVLIDFPGHKFSIGLPGTIPFRGPSAKVQLNADNGLIQVPTQIE